MSRSAADFDCDVAIIGYGPVGVSAANILGSYGISAIVFERVEDVYNRARAVTVNDWTLRHFQSVGLDAALKDIDYAFGPLKADGMVVFTNYAGRYLGDPQFDEIWAELNRRAAVVLVHPTSPGYELQGQPPQSIVEFPFDTVRAAISLMFSGVTSRFPSIKFVLSHAGGVLPFLAARIAGGAAFTPEIHERLPDVMGEIRKFWFDTALSGNPAALAGLLAVADPARILFGTDFPYALEIGIRANIAGTDHFAMTANVHGAVMRGNAARLLGREIAG